LLVGLLCPAYIGACHDNHRGDKNSAFHEFPRSRRKSYSELRRAAQNERNTHSERQLLQNSC
jgi:hypothetical protein